MIDSKHMFMFDSVLRFVVDSNIGLWMKVYMHMFVVDSMYVYVCG